MARPRKFDEATVIGAAKDVFWSHGYAGTSVDAVGAATKLGKGSLYGAFGGKRGLFHRVFDEYCSDAEQAAVRALEGSDEGALDRVRWFVGAGGAASGGDARRGCLLAKGVAELAEQDAYVAQRARKAFASIEAQLTAAIQAAQRHGHLDPQGDARVLAQTLLGLQRGIEAMWRAGAPIDAASMIDTALASHRPKAPERP